MKSSTSPTKPSYLVQEIFGSIQGEGIHAGRAAIFVRFSGCNLSCEFCDTDHTSHAHRILLSGLVERCNDLRKASPGLTHVVFTGGEPMLQVNTSLLEAFRREGYSIQIETNGTQPLFQWEGVWVTCSPKPGFLTQTIHMANEFKILVGKNGPYIPAALQLCLNSLLKRRNTVICFQPVEEKLKKESQLNLRKAIALVKTHPNSRLSVQLHKLIQVR